MGMYDTVLFNCLNCEHENEIQSKAGDCGLDRYTESTVPASIAGALDGRTFTCVNCGLGHEVITHVRVELHRRRDLSMPVAVDKHRSIDFKPDEVEG